MNGLHPATYGDVRDFAEAMHWPVSAQDTYALVLLSRAEVSVLRREKNAMPTDEDED